MSLGLSLKEFVMGMYDYVDFEAPCTNCGATVRGWQTKDGECFMATLKPSDVRNFYSSCIWCGTGQDAYVTPPEGVYQISINGGKPIPYTKPGKAG